MDIHEKFHEFVSYLNSLKLRDRDLYEQYAMMKNASSILDERTSELQSMILEEMKELGVEKQQFPYGGFTVTSRKTFTYTPAVKEKEQEVKDLKKKEEEDGVATFEIKNGLLFKGK